MSTSAFVSRRSTKVGAAVLAGAALLSAGVAGCSSENPTTSAVVVDREAGGALEIAKFFGEGVAMGLLEGGGKSMFDSLFGGEQGEDPNKERFDEISGKLGEIDGKLDQMQAQTKTLLDKTDDAAYAADLRELQDVGSAVSFMYQDSFMPLVRANQKLADDVRSGAAADVVDADRAAVATATENFRTDYKNGKLTIGTAAEKIHNYLLPGGTSVLQHKGATLMEKGYLTTTDSRILRAEYDLWADYQATAAMMTALGSELNGTVADSKRVVTTWQAARDSEVAKLPPRIGTGTVVVTPNGTTQGAEVFVAPARTQKTWLPTYGLPKVAGLPVTEWNETQLGDDPDPASSALGWAGAATDIIRPYEGQYGNEMPGHQDWRVWSNSDAKVLTTAVAGLPGATVGERLSALADDTDPTNLDPGKNWKALADGGYVWTSDSTSFKADCEYGVNDALFEELLKKTGLPVNPHMAVDMGSNDGAIAARANSLPRFYSVGNYDKENDGARACWVEGRNELLKSDETASFLLVRTAQADENYMLEKGR